MQVLKEKLDRRKWNKCKNFESSYTNNMVTKDVEAYKNSDYLVIATYTKVSGYSIEVYTKPEKGTIGTEVYRGDVESREKFGEVVEEVIREESLN